MMNSRNAVCVIVHDQNRDQVALLQCGSRTWFPEPVWSVPGGKAEVGEPLDAAAARELTEETGLIVDVTDLTLAHVIHVKQGWDQKGQFILFVFAASNWTGELQNVEPDKHLQVRWVDITCLPEPLFPTASTALAAYLSGGPPYSRYGW